MIDCFSIVKTKSVKRKGAKPKIVSKRFLDFCEYVQKLRKDKDFSTGDIERNSGGTISDATISKLENKKSKSMELDTIEALAKGFQEPLITLLEAFYGYELVPRENQYSLKDLSPKERELIDSVLHYLIAGIKTGGVISGELNLNGGNQAKKTGTSDD